MIRVVILISMCFFSLLTNAQKSESQIQKVTGKQNNISVKQESTDSSISMIGDISGDSNEIRIIQSSGKKDSTLKVSDRDNGFMSYVSNTNAIILTITSLIALIVLIVKYYKRAFKSKKLSK